MLDLETYTRNWKKKCTCMVSKHSLSSIFKYYQNFPKLCGRPSSGSKRKKAETQPAWSWLCKRSV